MSRQLITSYTPGESLAGFSRAVRVGNAVWVSGTVAIDSEGAVQHLGDAGGQTAYILRKIEIALDEAGASLAHVVRTRIFARDTVYSDAVARAHAKVFAEVRPANTLLRAEPLDPEALVEIEADAVIQHER